MFALGLSQSTGERLQTIRANRACVFVLNLPVCEETRRKLLPLLSGRVRDRAGACGIAIGGVEILDRARWFYDVDGTLRPVSVNFIQRPRPTCSIARYPSVEIPVCAGQERSKPTEYRKTSPQRGVREGWRCTSTDSFRRNIAGPQSTNQNARDRR